MALRAVSSAIVHGNRHAGLCCAIQSARAVSREGHRREAESLTLRCVLIESVNLSCCYSLKFTGLYGHKAGSRIYPSGSSQLLDRDGVWVKP